MQLVVVAILLVAFVVVAPAQAFYPAHGDSHYASSPQKLFSLAEPVDEKHEKQTETPLILLLSEGTSSSSSSSAMPQSTELWLDLRGTAMTPQTAIAYLEQNLQDDVISFEDEVDSSEGTMKLDGIIVPEEYRSQLKEPSPEVKVIFWDDKQQRLSSTESVDDSIGQVMIARPNHLLNPMEVMEVLTNLPWAVIQKAENTEDMAFVEEIHNLLSVILSMPSKHGGGTAVSCSNRAILVEVSKIIALSQSHNHVGMTKTTTSTSSGILLAQSDDSWILGAGEESTDEAAQKIAVVLPLDPELWRIAQDFLV